MKTKCRLRRQAKILYDDAAGGQRSCSSTATRRRAKIPFEFRDAVQVPRHGGKVFKLLAGSVGAGVQVLRGCTGDKGVHEFRECGGAQVV